jgi:hypothetical protein
MAQDVAEQVQAIREAFVQTRASIEADQRLTPEPRAEQIAAARASANKQITALHAEVESGLLTARSTLERKLCSRRPFLGRQTADRITRDASYRDALERARRVPANSSGGLVELLDQAELVGDDLRARAVLAIGLQRGDAVAVNRYTSTRQAEEADVDRLYELLPRRRRWRSPGPCDSAACDGGEGAHTRRRQGRPRRPARRALSGAG